MPKPPSQKQKKAAAEPTLGGALFYGIFFGMLGVFVGFYFVAAFGPKQVPDEAALAERIAEFADAPPRPGHVYFVRPPAAGPDWVAARAAILEGEEPRVSVTDRQINGWLQSSFPSTPSREAPSGIALAPQRASFTILENGRVQMTVFCDFFQFGKRKDLVLVGELDFERGGPNLYTIDSLRFNSAQIPPVPFLKSMVLGMVVKSFRGAEEYARVMDLRNRVENIEVANGNFHFSLRP